MKTRMTIEFEGPSEGAVSKPVLDGFVCDYLSSSGLDLRKIRVVGPYTDENGNPVTSDFFIDESDIRKTMENAGLTDEEIQTIQDKDAIGDILVKYEESVASTEDGNRRLKELFYEITKNYLKK